MKHLLPTLGRQPRKPRYARAASLLLGATLWAASAPAQTASSDAARAVQLNEAGAELYATGNYEGALAAFERAYSLIMEPNLLFNIAGCYERLGQPARAVEYYQRFLRAPQADPEGRKRAVESLASLEPLTPVHTAAAADARPSPPIEPSVWDHPAWPVLTLGTGILLAGLGTGLYLDGARDHDEVTGAPNYGDAPRPSPMTEVEAQRLIDSGDTKKLIGGIGLGIGGTLIATHVVLTVWRSTQGEASQVRAQLRLLPGGCLVTGSF
jgi:tetratricopeptide (TPR) repeat protein